MLALRDHGPVAGTAAALLSFLQTMASTVFSGLISLLANGTALPMTGLMMLGAASGLVAARRAFRRRS